MISLIPAAALRATKNSFDEFPILVGLAAVAAVSFFISVFVYYAFDTLDTAPAPIVFVTAIVFVVLCLAPIVQLPAAAIDIAEGPQRARKLLGHGMLFVLLFVLNPAVQQGSRLNWGYVESLRQRAEVLHVVGKSQQEVIALLGQPSYVLPIPEIPGAVQLRYCNPLPMLWSAEFLVSIQNGRAEYVHIDAD
jgi:hypothetical protein